METLQPELTNNAIRVLSSRYLLHKNGGTETPLEMFQRVAFAVAAAESKWQGGSADKWAQEFYEMMSGLFFLPNSPTLMNAGTPLNQLSACFVLPVEDSLDAIFTTLKNAALIQQSGGGTGFNFSHLRPKGSPLSITQGKASGPVSFMKVFNAATEHIKHGGKRRGANMGILNISHPDIEEFIDCKHQQGQLSNFNISVGISNRFMEAVFSNSNWNLLHPKTGKTVNRVKATKLWNQIVENAWRSGEPGLIFTDTINAQNPLPALGKIEATNPCGEVPLLPFEACNLGSINLRKFVEKNGSINWPKMEAVIQTAVRFLDDVIEVSNFIVPETKTIVQQNRKIGLGVMGWAEMLVMLQIPYDSEAALALADRLMQFVQQKAGRASALLAQERGSFPNWNQSIYYPDRPMRNATCLSIAPTGTISIIAGTSSSIEPLFALAFERKQVLDGITLAEMNQLFLDYLVEYDFYSPDLIEEVKKSGSLAMTHSVSEEVKKIFKTALEISPEWHLKHQVIFQKYVDNAVSKTINLPEAAKVEDVARIYKLAWQQGAKGITVFRNRSTARQVLEAGIAALSHACKVCTSS